MKTISLVLATALLFVPFAASAEAGCCGKSKETEMKCMDKNSDAAAKTDGGCCKDKCGSTDSKKIKAAGAGSHDGSSGKSATKAEDSAISGSSAAFEAVNAKMHKDMSVEMTGDADVDFMKGMIPHHQGAIDMANVLLKYGKDPVTRKLAEDIIKAQESEIAMMNDWLAKRQK